MTWSGVSSPSAYYFVSLRHERPTPLYVERVKLYKILAIIHENPFQKLVHLCEVYLVVIILNKF